MTLQAIAMSSFVRSFQIIRRLVERSGILHKVPRQYADV